MTERDDGIAEAWDHEPTANEEYIIKVVATAGVNVDIEAAMKAGAQLICDVATVEGVMCEVVVGRIDREVSYTPRPSMTSHVIIYDVENGVAVAQAAAERGRKVREKIVIEKP